MPLLASEGPMIIRKLLEGAHEVQKIIKFQKQQGKGHAAVQVEWKTQAAPLSGPELRRKLEATAELDWPGKAKMALGEKVAKLREVGEAQGDKGLLQARGAVCTLLGWATPEWATGQEVRHREGRDTLKADAKAAQQQLRELQGRWQWQDKKADFQQSDVVATMNDRLLKEVEARKDKITRLKATGRVAAKLCRREKEAAERREEQMSQLGNTLKAAKKAKAPEQASWTTKEAN